MTSTQAALFWNNLQRENPGLVDVRQVGESTQGRPVYRSLVARDAPDRWDEIGGHVSGHSPHAEESAVVSTCATGEFMVDFVKSGSEWADAMKYRAQFSYDADGESRNQFRNTPGHVLAYLAGRWRGFGYKYCVDFDMPRDRAGSYDVALPESQEFADFLDVTRPDSITMHHRLGWGPAYSLAKSYGNYGMALSLSTLLQERTEIAPYNLDEPSTPRLAPGVFGPHLRMNNPAMKATSIPEFLESMGETIPYVVVDYPEQRVRAYPDLGMSIGEAFDAGTRRLEELARLHVNKLSALPFDTSLREHETTKDWLRAKILNGGDRLEDFVPVRRRREQEDATPFETFALIGRRVWFDVRNLAMASGVAEALGRRTLAEDLWNSVLREVDMLEEVFGFAAVPALEAMEAAALMDVLALGGSLRTTCFDFGESHVAYDLLSLDSQGVGAVGPTFEPFHHRVMA